MVTKARKSTARKSARSAKKRGSARKRSMRANARKGAKKRSAGPKRRAPARTAKAVARVKRVTREVVQQASAAVSAGVENLRDLGGNLVDRVRSNSSS